MNEMFLDYIRRQLARYLLCTGENATTVRVNPVDAPTACGLKDVFLVIDDRVPRGNAWVSK